MQHVNRGPVASVDCRQRESIGQGENIYHFHNLLQMPAQTALLYYTLKTTHALVQLQIKTILQGLFSQRKVCVLGGG